MQTAAIISRHIGLPVTVEIDLHEWVPDLSFRNGPGEGRALAEDFSACRGRWPAGEQRLWETIDSMEQRITGALHPTLAFDRVIAVTHGMLMHQFRPYGHIPNCFVDEIDYDEPFAFAGWRDKEQP